MSLSTLSEMKQQIERLQKEADMAEGELNQIMKQLKQEFNCDSIEEAEDALQELEQERKETKELFDSSLKAFKDKWEDIIDV